MNIGTVEREKGVAAEHGRGVRFKTTRQAVKRSTQGQYNRRQRVRLASVSLVHIISTVWERPRNRGGREKQVRGGLSFIFSFRHEEILRFPGWERKASGAARGDKNGLLLEGLVGSRVFRRVGKTMSKKVLR